MMARRMGATDSVIQLVLVWQPIVVMARWLALNSVIAGNLGQPALCPALVVGREERA